MKQNVENQIELYVFTNEYDEVVGTYEDEEISDFFNYYFDEVISEISQNHSLSEFIDYHMEYVAELTKYYNMTRINLENDNDLIKFLKSYNEIASCKLKYEKITASDEVEEQEFIAYVNEVKDGFKKYKENNHCIPVPTIEVSLVDIDNTMILKDKNTEEKIGDILHNLMRIEIDRLMRDYNKDELLFDKTDYLRDILDISYKFKNNLTSNYSLLVEFKDNYNDEFSLANKEIKIKIV